MSNEKLIEPPHEIICYALKVGDWFKERNITHWKLADCASRDALELADKRIAELEAKIDEAYRKGYATGEEEAERKLSVAREALESCGVNHGLNGPQQHYDESLVDTALAQIGGDE